MKYKTIILPIAVILAFFIIVMIYAQDYSMNLTPEGNLEIDGRVSDMWGYIMPVGTILPFAFHTPPPGWLICDGSIINKSTNPQLAALVDGLRAAGGGNSNHPYVKGLSSNQARLPDLRGDFLRGMSSMVNNGAIGGVTPPTSGRTGADPGTNDRRNPQSTQTVIGGVIGSWQDDAFQTHKHNELIRSNRAPQGGSIYRVFEENYAQYNQPDPYEPGYYTNFSTYNSSNLTVEEPTGTDVRVNTETRVNNTYVLYIIKF